jgi:hypothetical protein
VTDETRWNVELFPVRAFMQEGAVEVWDWRATERQRPFDLTNPGHSDDPGVRRYFEGRAPTVERARADALAAIDAEKARRGRIVRFVYPEAPGDEEAAE